MVVRYLLSCSMSTENEVGFGVLLELHDHRHLPRLGVNGTLSDLLTFLIGTTLISSTCTRINPENHNVNFSAVISRHTHMNAMLSQILTLPNVGRTLSATRSDSLRKSNDLLTSTLGVCDGLSFSLSDDLALPRFFAPS